MTTELDLYLKIKNLFIPEDQIHYLELKIMEECERGCRRLGHFAAIQGGLQTKDIAIALVFAKRVGAKEGFDWAWAQEYDSYHYNLGFSRTEKGNQLMKMYADYNSAVIKSIFNKNNEELTVIQR